jgi:CRP-like cAMP-binding protein
VRVFLVDFGDHAITYEIKFYMGNHSRINETNDSVRTNVWYELKRQRITIPFPVRTIHLQRGAPRSIEQEHDEARTILRNEPLFQCLSDEQIDSLVKQSHLNHFGRGERMVEEGAEGESMFVLLRGGADVCVSRNGSMLQVATLGAGDCFGEMSLLTGERRSATVRAERDCYVMEIGKSVMSEIIHQSPECLQQLSDILAERKLSTEMAVKDSATSLDQQAKEQEIRDTLMKRLRTFFSL